VSDFTFAPSFSLLRRCTLTPPPHQHHNCLVRILFHSAAAMAETVTSRTLSHIESLPTEIAQHVASYLLREQHYAIHHKWGWRNKRSHTSNGLSELRATSRTMQAKVEHIFKDLFTIKFLTFHRYTLKRLVQLAQSPTYSPLVKVLIFVPMEDAWHNVSPLMEDWHATDHWKLQQVMEEHAVQQLLPKNPPETSLLIVALRAFPSLRTILLSPGMQLPCPATVRRHSLLKHAPTMIMSAVVQSAPASLKSFHIVEWPTRSAGGLIPRVLNGLKRGDGLFSRLTSLTLVLTSRNRKLSLGSNRTVVTNPDTRSGSNKLLGPRNDLARN